MDEYFDLTNEDNDINTIVINRTDLFNCSLKNSTTGQVYKGFLLSRSQEGNRFTLCDANFQRSASDNKYQPRLTFKRTKSNLEEVRPPQNADYVRIPFAVGQDGYRNFWKMIFFLYKFKEQVDFGGFEGNFQVVTRQQFQDYLNNVSNIEEIKAAAQALDLEISEVIKSALSLRILALCREKLNFFIENNSSETDVQNWIDEDNHLHRKERCMIFGLEYIDFKREGSTSGKRFDILTRVGLRNIEHVLIELKSPADDIFSIQTVRTANGESQEYHLHNNLARAIPQILEYKSILEDKPAGDPELVAIGINGKIKISKCIIVIGKNSENSRWIQNRQNLGNSLNSSLEVWTYTDLLNKITSTIQNIENSQG